MEKLRNLCKQHFLSDLLSVFWQHLKGFFQNPLPSGICLLLHLQERDNDFCQVYLIKKRPFWKRFSSSPPSAAIPFPMAQGEEWERLRQILRAHQTTPIHLVFDAPFLNIHLLSTHSLGFWDYQRLQKKGGLKKEKEITYATLYQKPYPWYSRQSRDLLETEFQWPSSVENFIHKLGQCPNLLAGFYEENSWIASAVLATSFRKNPSYSWHFWIFRKKTGFCLLVGHKGILRFVRSFIQEEDLSKEIDDTHRYLKRFGLTEKEILVVHPPWADFFQDSSKTKSPEALAEEPDDIKIMAKILSKDLRAYPGKGFFPPALKPHAVVFKLLQWGKKFAQIVFLLMIVISGNSQFLCGVDRPVDLPPSTPSRPEVPLLTNPSPFFKDSLYCGGILYLSEEQWTVWINDSPLRKIPGQIPVQETKEGLWKLICTAEEEVVIAVQTKDGWKEIRLQPDQTYDGLSQNILEGDHRLNKTKTKEINIAGAKGNLPPEKQGAEGSLLAK